MSGSCSSLTWEYTTLLFMLNRYNATCKLCPPKCLLSMEQPATDPWGITSDHRMTQTHDKPLSACVLCKSHVYGPVSSNTSMDWGTHKPTCLTPAVFAVLVKTKKITVSFCSKQGKKALQFQLEHISTCCSLLVYMYCFYGKKHKKTVCYQAVHVCMCCLSTESCCAVWPVPCTNTRWWLHMQSELHVGPQNGKHVDSSCCGSSYNSKAATTSIEYSSFQKHTPFLNVQLELPIHYLR